MQLRSFVTLEMGCIMAKLVPAYTISEALVIFGFGE